MSTYSASEQVRFSEQWFRTWSDLQKEDFVHVLVQKLSQAASVTVNGMVNGFQNLDTSGRPPSLFACQVKLFNEWWDSWTKEDREKFTAQLKDSDAKFWTSVEGELDGSRKKDLDDFFPVDVPIPRAPSELTSKAEQSGGLKTIEGDDDVKVVSISASSGTLDQDERRNSSVTNIEISGTEVGSSPGDGISQSQPTRIVVQGGDS